MNHDGLVLLFLQLGVMLGVALLFGQLARRCRQPAVLGELIGGILVGPTVLGTLLPNAYAWLFPNAGLTFIGRDAVIKIGLLFFLFGAGLEVNLGQLSTQYHLVALTSVFAVLLPFSLGVGSVLLLPDLWGMVNSSQTLTLALFAGTALSISALPVIARILLDLNLMQTKLGALIMAAATVNDLIGWSLFAIILATFTSNNAIDGSPWAIIPLVVGFAALLLALGRWAGLHALDWLHDHWTWPSSFIGAASVFLLFAAAAAEALGVHAILGAFLVGVGLASGAEKKIRAKESIYQFAVSFFAPIYFVSIGLQTNFAANFDLPLVLLVCVLACAGKILGASSGALAGGIPLRSALVVGFGLNARGAIELILASVALEYGLISESIFVALVVMALFTSMLSGPIMQRLMTAESWGKRNLRELTA